MAFCTFLYHLNILNINSNTFSYTDKCCLSFYNVDYKCIHSMNLPKFGHNFNKRFILLFLTVTKLL